jgi:hypothetical protein
MLCCPPVSVERAVDFENGAAEPFIVVEATTATTKTTTVLRIRMANLRLTMRQHHRLGHRSGEQQKVGVLNLANDASQPSLNPGVRAMITPNTEHPGMKTLVTSLLAAGLILCPLGVSAQTATQPQAKQPAAKTAPATNRTAGNTSRPKGTHAYKAKHRLARRHAGKRFYAKRRAGRTFAYRSRLTGHRHGRHYGYRAFRGEDCR